MAVALQRSETEIKRTSVQANVPNNDVAHLMYYLSCVFETVDCINDPDLQRYISYQNHDQLSHEGQKVLVLLCEKFSPDILNRKVFFQNDAFCVQYENEFYTIDQVNNVLVGTESVVIGGVVRYVKKCMAYKMSWLQRYYIGPIGRLKQKLTTDQRSIPTQPIHYRPIITTVPSTNTGTSAIVKQTCCQNHKVICIIICVILFILPGVIGGIITATNKSNQ